MTTQFQFLFKRQGCHIFSWFYSRSETGIITSRLYFMKCQAEVFIDSIRYTIIGDNPHFELLQGIIIIIIFLNGFGLGDRWHCFHRWKPWIGLVHTATHQAMQTRINWPLIVQEHQRKRPPVILVMHSLICSRVSVM